MQGYSTAFTGGQQASRLTKMPTTQPWVTKVRQTDSRQSKNVVEESGEEEMCVQQECKVLSVS